MVSEMSRLIGSDHHIVDDGGHVNPLGVEDGVNEVAVSSVKLFLLVVGRILYVKMQWRSLWASFSYQLANHLYYLSTLTLFCSKVSLWIGNAIGS